MGRVAVTVGIPLAIALAIIAVICAIVYAGSARRAKRYRPGRPFPFTPVWFLAAPQDQVTAGGRQLSAAGRPAISGPGVESAPGEQPVLGETGGASDRW